MLEFLRNWLFGRPKPAARPGPEAEPALTVLDHGTPGAPATYLCRETVLGRDQRIAGYRFSLRNDVHNHVRVASRRVQHLIAEILVHQLVAADIGRRLGRRLAFIDIPDSFLTHSSLEELPRGNTVLVVHPCPGAGAPEPAQRVQAAKRLRASGARLALPDPRVIRELAPLLPLADFLVVQAQALGTPQGGHLSQLRVAVPQATLLVCNLETLEHFRYCYIRGTGLFQGPFITRREEWAPKNLDPGRTLISTVISRLQSDADVQELADLLKQDAAIALRLLRYINSAAVALPERVSSIERALVLLGRSKLYRWMILLAYDRGGTGERSAAALETALVRARLMELLGEGRPAAEREALFLVGLLSLADVILQTPMEQALAPLAPALTPDIHLTLTSADGPWRDHLELACACEGAEGERIAAAAERCGVAPGEASRCHLDALAWAMEVQQ